MKDDETALFDATSPLYRAACQVAATLRQAGCQALFAGGCVRDALLHRPLKDVDIATSATPDEVERLFQGHTVPVGKSFGVIVVTQDGVAFEVATFRADGAYTDGRHPADVRFTDPAEDAKRRDFTINGLFYDPRTHRTLDHVGGMRDLAEGVVRAIGDPAERFREDRLRLLRAVRFAAVLEFRLDETTATAIRTHAGLLATVSAERIGMEFTRMLCEAPRPSVALDLLNELGLLRVFLPEVAAMKGVQQPAAFHPEGDVWTHTCLMLDAIPEPRDPTLAYAVLLHDIGKPPTRHDQNDGHGGIVPRFPCHAKIGGLLARDLLMRLRRPTELTDDVCAAVERHMTFCDLPNMRPAKLRRFMGAHTFPMERELHRLDVTHSHGKLGTLDFLARKQAEFASDPVLPEPWLKGRDLLAMGLKPGPDVGRWLNLAYDAQLDGIYADRNELLAWLRRAMDLAQP